MKFGSFLNLTSISLLPYLGGYPQPPVEHETHWVVPGRIMAGSSPGDMKKSELESIINSGIDTFVNLQMDYDENVIADYRNTLRKMIQYKINNKSK